MNKTDILKKYFGYDTFREGQETLIDAVLGGQDVLGIMPTGAGKSICYQVPALLLPGITLVISPLISLMKDQVQALNQAGIHAAYINSSLTEAQIATALRYAAQGRYKIIYVAPERLESSGFLAFARQVQISMLTVDEAHCISQWGQDFRPSYLKIVRFLKSLQVRPVVSAFTATATERVREDIICVLGLRSPNTLVTGFDRKNLYFAVENPRNKDRYVVQYIREHAGESGIIYCATRKNVDTLCALLNAEGIPAAAYHAGRGNEERARCQEDFIYDKCQVMVATNAFGMGIDKSNVRYVIHYNMPQSLENYYQEAGRAGRDGEASECILLYSPQDVVINRFLLGNKEENPDYTAEELAAVRERDEERLRAMIYYCLTTDCLRTYILRYFDERRTAACGNCSNCLKEFEETDVTEQAKQIIACVLETRQRYGINVIAGTLAGENRAKLREYGMMQCSSYGALKGQSEGEIRQIIERMLLEGLLVQTADRYALLKVTVQGGELLRGESAGGGWSGDPKLSAARESGAGICGAAGEHWSRDERPAAEEPGVSVCGAAGERLSQTEPRTVVLRRPKGDPASEGAKSGGRKKSAAKNRRSDILNSKGLELFERLRGLRTRIAREESIPPYIVFSDKTLTDMCVRVPFTKEEMLAVSGVGEMKFEKYGGQFLQEIQAATGGMREKTYFGEI